MFYRVSCALTALFFAWILIGCADFKSQTVRKIASQADNGSKANEAGLTFDQILGVATSTPPPESSPVPVTTPPNFYPSPTPTPVATPAYPLTLTPEAVDMCQTGELDMIDAAGKCGINRNLILTIVEGGTERLMYSSPLSAGSYTTAGLLQSLRTTVTRTGPVDFFICIDSNRNTRCTDEKIFDINPLSARVNALYLAAGGPAHVSPAAYAAQVCPELAGGAVLFHTQNGAATGPGTAAQLSAANAIKGILRNIRTSSSYVADIPSQVKMPLVRYSQTVCPVPATRSDGCFVKGTKISISKTTAVEIEKLVPESPIWLADGRLTKVKKVVAGPETKPVIAFETANGSKLEITSEHPLLTNKGLKLAKDVSIGEELKTAEGKFVAIVSISQRLYSDLVYNIELEGPSELDHLVLAEGLVAGDLHLQNKLSTPRPAGLNLKWLTRLLDRP